MRKFKLLALAFVIGMASVFAVNSGNPEGPEKEIRDQIVKLLQTPDFTVTEEMNVVLKFTFNSEGEIVVLCAGCKDKEIVDYIRKNLNHKKFKTPGERDKIYTIPLKIRAG
jgi:hypothetical protein